MSDIYDEVASYSEGSEPSQEDLASLSESAEQYAQLCDEIREQETALKEKKRQKYTMEHQTLPDMMTRVGTDLVGVPTRGYDMKLEPFYKANISAEWEPERRERAFQHLEEIGGGDLVRTTLTVSAGRDSLEKITQIAQRVTQMLAEVDLDASVEIGKSVPWNSLTSFVKKHVEAGEPMDSETLGATVGQVVKLKERR